VELGFFTLSLCLPLKLSLFFLVLPLFINKSHITLMVLFSEIRTKESINEENLSFS
jgi:hypothetical protein